MPNWFRHPPCRTHGRRTIHTFHPTLQELEDRYLLAAPVVDAMAVPLNIPATKSLLVPITALDPDGGSVSCTVTSSNPLVQVTAHPNNTYLDLTVAGYGEMRFQLFNDLAPTTAALIGGMAQGEFFDGLTFHRVVKGFMLQGGDPAGNGSGGPGFRFDDEFNTGAIFSGIGQLAMANSGDDTNGSQFFITTGTARHLDFNHTVFGQLVRGFNVLGALDSAPVQLQNPNDPNSEKSRPVPSITITSARVVQDFTDAVFTLSGVGASVGATTTLTVTATASTGGSTTRTFQAQVVADVNALGQPNNAPPILGPVSDRVSPTSAPVTVHLTGTDLENDSLIFDAAVLNPNTGNATLTVTNNGNGTADVVVMRTGSFTGPVRVIVGVRTASSNFDTQIITVAFGDQPISLSAAGPANATEGAVATLTLATLTDADATAVPADYQVSINWGDGSTLDTTTGQVVLDNGQFKVTGAHTYREAGTYPVRVVVTGVPQSGASGATANLTLTATVADAALTSQGVAVSTTAGSSSPVTVATFTDANPFAEARDFTARITWGDGTNSAGTVAAAPGGGFRVLGSHAYAAAGHYPVSVTVTEILTAGTVAPAMTTATTTASIAPAPIPPAAPPAAPALPQPVVVALVTLRKGGRAVLTVRVTGGARMEFASPFQKTAGYQQVAAVAVDTNGDGVADGVEVRARRGKRLLKRLFRV